MKNKIIAFFNIDSDNPGGWIDNGKQYRRFHFNGDKIVYGDTRNKSEFYDYSHFIGVMGKFNPYQIFIKQPIVISDINLGIFKNEYKRFKSVYPGYPE